MLLERMPSSRLLLERRAHLRLETGEGVDRAPDRRVLQIPDDFLPPINRCSIAQGDPEEWLQIMFGLECANTCEKLVEMKVAEMIRLSGLLKFVERSPVLEQNARVAWSGR